MHFSIAPVEVQSHMRQQFETIASAPGNHRGDRRIGMRQLVSAVLLGLADRLDPAPAR